MKDIYKMDFYECFLFLEDHPAFRGCFTRQLDVEVAKVNPKTGCIDRDKHKNTRTEVWLECGDLRDPGQDPNIMYHNPYLDCGGATFEEAIIRLAHLVYERFGGY